MQREGLFYLFEHDLDAERMLIVDHNTLLPQQPLHALWQPHEHMPTSHLACSVHDWQALHTPLPRQIVLHQRNHRKAGAELLVRCQVCPDGFGELVLDHIDFRSHDEGLRYASLLAQQLRCHARTLRAASSFRGLRCGQLLQLHAHPRADFNRPYLITRVTHHARQHHPDMPAADASYACTLHLIDHDTPFRLEHRTAWPRIAGTLFTAGSIARVPQTQAFAWSPQLCSTLRLHIALDGLQLERVYPGASGLADFLAEFRDGSHGFAAEDFAQQTPRLHDLGVRRIILHYRIDGAAAVLRTADALRRAEARDAEVSRALSELEQQRARLLRPSGAAPAANGPPEEPPADDPRLGLPASITTCPETEAAQAGAA